MAKTPKIYLEKSVYEAALERLHLVFERFPRVCVSFSGGKDSTVLLNLTLDIARVLGKGPVHVLFVDWESQYQMTIDHVADMMRRDDVVPWWICLPLTTDSGVSTYEPLWVAWDREKRDVWTRQLPDKPGVVSDYEQLPFYHYGMSFEEFVPKFQEWLAGDEPLGCLIGVRADESLRRFKAIKRDKKKCAYDGIRWSATQDKKRPIVNFFPLYDWRVEDIWSAIGKHGWSYNRIYDRMYLAGLSLHQMRIDEPFSGEARKNLELYHQIEPETWNRMAVRVAGANAGKIYGKVGSRDFYAHGGITKPNAFPTWKSYAEFLLGTLPLWLRDHYQRRIDVFIQWFRDHKGWTDLKDEDDPGLESAKLGGSWRMVCKTILKNDHFCGTLSFQINKREHEKMEALKEKYKDL